MSIATPEFVKQMTNAEYKAWVETGAFPDRLVPVRDAEQKAKREAKIARQKKREQKNAGGVPA